MRTLIGAVNGTTRDKYGDLIAWIRPLLESEGDTWSRISTPEAEFPGRGYIFWPRANGAKEGALVRFHAKENNVKNDGPDEYMVSDAQPAFEVIDLREEGGCEQARQILTEGITLLRSASPKFFIRCEENLVVGPIALVFDTLGKASLEAANRARIPCYQLEDYDFLEVVWGEDTRTVLTKQMPATPTSYVDWDEDKPVMRRALELASRLKGSDAGVTKQFLEDAAFRLTQFGPDASARLEAYRLQRAVGLANDTTEIGRLAGELFSMLRSHPAIIEELRIFVEEQRAAIRSSIGSEVRSEQDRLDQLTAQRKAAEETLELTNRNLKGTQETFTTQVSGFESALHQRINEAMDNVPRLLAEAAVLKPFMGLPSVPEQRPVDQRWPSPDLKVTELKELKSALIKALRSNGVETTSYQPIHAALRAGLLPVVTGPLAINALQAYSHVVCGGRMLVLEVTSAIADVQDLFGSVQNAIFIPHAAGLIDLVRETRDNEGPYLVVLNGINRGPTESYLLPLLRLLQSPSATVPLFHPTAVRTSSPYSSDARVQWPRNLLLSATTVEGPTTLPVAPDVWRSSVLINAAADRDHREFSVPPTVSELETANSLWKPDVLHEQQDVFSENFPEIARTAHLFLSGISGLISDESARQDATVMAVVVPYLASITDEEERHAEVARFTPLFGAELENRMRLARRSLG